jgi:hypothetical protein
MKCPGRRTITPLCVVFKLSGFGYGQVFSELQRHHQLHHTANLGFRLGSASPNCRSLARSTLNPSSFRCDWEKPPVFTWACSCALSLSLSHPIQMSPTAINCKLVPIGSRQRGVVMLKNAGTSPGRLLVSYRADQVPLRWSSLAESV